MTNVGWRNQSKGMDNMDGVDRVDEMFPRLDGGGFLVSGWRVIWGVVSWWFREF